MNAVGAMPGPSGGGARRWGRGLARAVAATVFDSPTYRWTLLGSKPRSVARLPVDPWAGDPIQGGHILQGELRIAGDRIRTEGMWRMAVLPNSTLAAMHGFRWLRDLRALGTPTAAAAARGFVDEWLAIPPLWQPVAWRSDVLGERLFAWLAHADWFAGSSDPAFDRRLLDGIAAGCRHLSRVASWELDGEGCIAAAKGLVAVGTSLVGAEGYIRGALRILDRELPRQIAPDGGHLSRNPAAQGRVLAHLVEIRGALAAARHPIPDSLTQAIDRAAPVLRFFRHGDGGLALFNGSREGEAKWLDTLLTHADAKGRPPLALPHTGFQRMVADRTTVLVDTGQPPPRGFDRGAHAGLLSFELSVGKERLIVNCGAHPTGAGDWELAQRATAAHSTLSVEDRNSVEVVAGRGIGRRPKTIGCERREADGATLLDLHHDGYAPAYGTVHHRSLYLAASGEDLRGEDRLEGAAGRSFVIRFHLHPTVQVSLTQGGNTVFLRGPSGTGWRLRVSGAAVGLADSVYLGGRGDPRRTQQILLSGETTAEGTKIRWALQREDRKG
ncbi:heparinase II/III family protein [Stella sp.]|uniref:heparinase II/III family protein n=1 Tax=Stella sp. TaxID=2912054 RepID=UPI0035B19953